MMRPVLTIAAAWAQFEQTFLTHDIPAVQRKEMRRVFYTGGQATINVIQSVNGNSDPPAHPRIAELYKEFDQFYLDCEEGRA